MVFFFAVLGNSLNRRPSLIVAQSLERIAQHVKGGSQRLPLPSSLRFLPSALLLRSLLRQFLLSPRLLAFPHFRVALSKIALLGGRQYALLAEFCDGMMIVRQGSRYSKVRSLSTRCAVFEGRLAKRRSLPGARLVAPARGRGSKPPRPHCVTRGGRGSRYVPRMVMVFCLFRSGCAAFL